MSTQGIGYNNGEAIPVIDVYAEEDRTQPSIKLPDLSPIMEDDEPTLPDNPVVKLLRARKNLITRDDALVAIFLLSIALSLTFGFVVGYRFHSWI